MVTKGCVSFWGVPRTPGVTTRDHRLLVDVQPRNMGVDNVHRLPRQHAAAGRMPLVQETNVRAARQVPGTTKRCAAQHPDRSTLQVRNTKQLTTSMPAVRRHDTRFSSYVVGDAHGHLLSNAVRSTLDGV